MLTVKDQKFGKKIVFFIKDYSSMVADRLISPTHAGCTENDTPKISPCFANHNVIEKKFISAYDF